MFLLSEVFSGKGYKIKSLFKKFSDKLKDRKNMLNA